MEIRTPVVSDTQASPAVRERWLSDLHRRGHNARQRREDFEPAACKTSRVASKRSRCARLVVSIVDGLHSGTHLRRLSVPWRGALLLVFAIGWVLIGLIGHDPWKPDEAYTFGIVVDFLKHGDWVVPSPAGEPFVEKPPLFFLAVARFAQVFGQVLPCTTRRDSRPGSSSALRSYFSPYPDASSAPEVTAP